MTDVLKMMEVARDSIEIVFKKQFGVTPSFAVEKTIEADARWCSDEERHIATTAEIHSNEKRYCLIFCFTEKSFLSHISTMFGRDFEEISSDLHDLISEWLNMAMAKMKIYLNDEMGLEFSSSIPMTILGQKLCVPNISSEQMLNVEISSNIGEFDFFLVASEKTIVPWDLM